MKFSITGLLLCSLFATLPAQPTIEWQKCLGGTDAEDATEIQQTNDGGYVVIGKTLSINGDLSGNHGGTDVWLVKLNSTGDIQWQKSLGGSKHDWGFSVQQTNDDGYIVTGFSESNNGDVSGNHGDKDAWIAKLDSSGDIQWQKSLGGSKADLAYRIRQTSDNGYIMAGSSISIDGDLTENHGFMDYWVVKLNEGGNIQWQKSLGGSLSDIAYAVRQTSDEGYVVVGESDSNDGDVTGAHGSSDYWVVKLSSTGELEWQKALGTTSYDRANDVFPTSDGGYIIIGEISANNGDVTGHHGSFDFWAVKLDGLGEIQWQKALGGSDEEFGRYVRQTLDGGYVLTGVTGSTNGDVIGNDGGQDVWVVKLSSAGEIKWQKTLGGTLGDLGNSIQETTDGGFAIAGYTRSTDGDASGIHSSSSDFWVVKLSPLSTPTSAPSFLPLEIFPNPAHQSISLKNSTLSTDPTESSEELTVSITDLLGRKLSRQTISADEPIDISTLPNGMYILTATTPSGKVFSGKFRKQE